MEEQLAASVQLRKDGRPEEARTLLLALAREHPDNARIHYQAAWSHDALGLEREAVPFYERALQLGLYNDDLAGALLGLGSTYRTLGEYDSAISRLREGVNTFPDDRSMQVFLAMALYNVGEHREAMELLMGVIATTSDDQSIRKYERAIAFYADKLDETW